MIREEVVFYLKSNLGRFRVQELKTQLLLEGVSEEEFKAGLKAAKRAKSREFMGKFLMISGVFSILAALIFFLARRPPQNSDETLSRPVFISALGYVVHIPEGYTAIKSSDSKDRETVYFCQVGTDPSTFLDRGLYGQLGIVRLKVMPRPFAQDGRDFSKLTRLVSSKAKTDGSPFQISDMEISDMKGLEISFGPPASRILSYVLGRRNLYIFLSGPSDPLYPSILRSLRETQ